MDLDESMRGGDNRLNKRVFRKYQTQHTARRGHTT